MLHAVLVSRDEAASDSPVVGVLPGVVEEMAVAIQPFDDLRTDRRLLAEPDRRAEHEDVRGGDLLEEGGPVVSFPTVLLHVRPDTRRDVVIDGTHDLDR